MGRFIEFARGQASFQIGLVIIVVWALIALLAPVIAPYPPTEPHPMDVLQPPGGKYLLGTDKDGMDILSRIVWAPRIDLGIAVTSTAFAILIGVPIGALAGYFGGRGGIFGLVAEWLMRVIDVSLAFPVFIFALALVAVLGASATNVILAMIFVNTPVFVWLTRSEVLGIRERPFVEAARCSGNGDLRIAFRHVLPNSLAAPLTQLSVVLGFSILLTAGLSFLGAGVPVPTPEWGLMVSQGASTMITGQWWTALFPGLALATAVLGFALVGDGLRIYLDPKQRTQLQRVVGQEIVNPVDAPAV
jgi:peptide/nickel transport system permease protein